MSRGLMFHHFHGGEHPVVQGSWSAEELVECIARYCERLLPAQVFLACHRAGTLRDEDLVLTFDDGLRSQYDIARPIVEAAGLTAFWFVPTAPLIGVPSRLEQYRWLRTVAYPSVEAFYEAWHGAANLMIAPWDYLAERPYLSADDRAFRYWRDEIATPQEYERVMDALMPVGMTTTNLGITRAELRHLHTKGHVIGPHSHSHPTRMDQLTNEQQEIEYVTSTYILEQMLGTRPVAMSHPCNRVTTYGLDVLRGLGYQLGFCATDTPGDALTMPRLNSADLRVAVPA